MSESKLGFPCLYCNQLWRKNQCCLCLLLLVWPDRNPKIEPEPHGDKILKMSLALLKVSTDRLQKNWIWIFSCKMWFLKKRAFCSVLFNRKSYTLLKYFMIWLFLFYLHAYLKTWVHFFRIGFRVNIEIKPPW